MKRINNILFSMELTGILLILFAISIGYATFVENDFGTVAAKSGIYNARWFEGLLVLLAINITGSIFKHKMIQKKKWTTLTFHAAFLIIFVGAAITRYISYEGTLHIREGQSANVLITDRTYIAFDADDGTFPFHYEKSVFATPKSAGSFSHEFDYNDKAVKIDVIQYFQNATESVVEGEGNPLLWLVISDIRSGRQDYYFRQGDIKNIGSYKIGFDAQVPANAISITSAGNQLEILAPDSVSHMSMATGITKMMSPGLAHAFQPMALYKIGEISIVIKNFYEKAKIGLTGGESKDDQKSPDAFIARITAGSETGEVTVYGGQGFITSPSEITLSGIFFRLNYGAKAVQLPFALYLNDFQLERYPGSNSPSSFASEVTILDESRNMEMPYRIYMNHVLNYRGFRFFQSSYEKDEKGTILSVSHDAAGTIVTYLGYFLMAVGMVLTLFNRNSRFRNLISLSTSLRETRKTLSTVLIIMASMVLSSLPEILHATTSESKLLPDIDKAHAEKFGRLMVQDKDGRMKPVNTFSSEVLRKIARKNSFNGMNPDQVFLGILAYPDLWQSTPIIKVSNPELKEFLKLNSNYASFSQIVDVHSPDGYRIGEYVENAYAKKPALQNKFDKEVMKVDERVNVFYMIYSGTFLVIFPVPGDPGHKWTLSKDADQYFKNEEAMFVGGIVSMYLEAVRKGVETGDWKEANENLDDIIQFQKKYGEKIYPSESLINLEILYNKLNIFSRLSGYYGMIGIILLILHFANILRPRFNLHRIIRIFSYLIIVLFTIHTAGLAVRWYVSGHAPWSNAYESLIYIGWATSLSGLIFVRRSQITLTVTALMTSLILSVASMNWMDPEITNLVPVLKSYWLVIHVAIITGSYGFLGLGALLGFFNLLLMNMKSRNNSQRLDLTIGELSCVIEMTLIIGLFMITIGTFLGGVWANESWGRYWGWDPKETWALVTVLVYSFVAHMRFIPGFRGNFALSFASVIGYSSVMMTYFGVNYYLSGLHSYAKGDPVPVPTFVYYTLITIAVVSLMAFITNRRFAAVPLKS
jgi:cytochrome c-type biogenesis protein CcsB